MTRFYSGSMASRTDSRCQPWRAAEPHFDRRHYGELATVYASTDRPVTRSVVSTEHTSNSVFSKTEERLPFLLGENQAHTERDSLTKLLEANSTQGVNRAR